MEQGLFAKHIQKIQKIVDTKKNIQNIIFEKTGVLLEDNELTISKNKVILSVSSVKKNSLIQKNYKQVLIENGFTVSV